MRSTAGRVGMAVAAVLAGAGARSAAAQESFTVTVVATTDVHGRAMHWDYVQDREAPWGLSRASSVIDSLRRSGEALVLVDAGDLIQGNAFAAFYASDGRLDLHPVVDATNAIGYDVLTPGNHDFNFGVGFMDSALAGAQAQVVSGNIYRPDYRGPAFREYAVLNRGPVRIGVTGFTTPGAMVWDRAHLPGRREVRPIVPEAERVLARLRAEGVDLKVVVIHSGMGGASSYDTTGVGAENVAARLAGLGDRPDLVVVGHSHGVIRDSVINGVHFIQPPPWARGLAVARATFRPDAAGSYVLDGIVAEQIPLADVPSDPDFVRRMDDAHRRARSWVNATVAVNRGEWSGQFSRAGDSPLVDFVNEVQRRAAGADLSATAAFDTGARLPDREVRRRDVMGLYPYENTLKAVRIDGETLRAYLERSAQYFNTYEPGRPILNPRWIGYNFDMVSGVEYTVDLSRPVGSRIRQLSRGGRLVEPDDVFTLAVNNYRQGGGGGFDMFAGLPVVYDEGENVRDLLMREVRRVGELDSSMYYRPSWWIVPGDAARAVRVAFGEEYVTDVEHVALRILATTDWRGAVEPRVLAWSGGRPVGGAVALKGWVDSLGAACECVMVRVDAGDQLAGSLTADRAFGRPTVEIMNAVGLDAAVIGPEDLRWGLDTLRSRAAAARYATLAANVERPDSAGRPPWVQEWVMIERAGVRVAIVGLLLPDTAAGAAGRALVARDPLAALRRVLPAVRAAGPDFVTVAVHGEAWCDDTGCRGALFDLVESLEPGAVDLVLGGHSDTEATAVVNGIPVLLPGSYGLSLGVADLVRGGGAAPRVDASVVTMWADSIRQDSVLSAMVRSYRGADDEVVARMKFPAAPDPEGESALGRLVADAYRNAARTQIAVVRSDGLRAGLAAGAVTRRDVYAVQPVQHTIHRMALRGQTITEMLEHILGAAAPRAHVSGIRVEYDPDRDAGRRVRRVEFMDGRALRRDDVYSVAVDASLARGGHGFGMLAGHDSEDAGISDFEALVTYLVRLGGEVEAPEPARFRPR